MDGILLVDKPGGWTSHDVVARVRRLAGQRRIGHTGTLDPMATGLLVLCLGKATRLVEYMTAHDKAYSGEIVLGTTTNTDDADGEVVATGVVPHLSDEQLQRLAARFTGTSEQVPPRFSAIQRGGVRAHAVARRGGDPGLEARTVVIRSLALAGCGPGRLALQVECGPGTYVRSLARDIGRELGCGAHLGALRRERAGRFRIEDAVTLDEVRELSDAGLLAEALLSPDEGVAEIDAALLQDEGERLLCQGQTVRVKGGPVAAGALRVYGATGRFVGIGALSDGSLKPLKVFSEAVQV